jgi:hypothetical protein
MTPPHGMRRNAAFCGLLAAAILLLPALPVAAETSLKELLTDPADGAFDMSRFLQTRTGFVPILAPITEPAVGYGAAGGLVFFHRKQPGKMADAVPAEEGRMTPPSLSVLAGFATENGSWGAFAGHRGVWMGDRVRYLGGLGYASLNLEFYGTGAQTSDISRDFEIQTVPFIQDIAVRIPDSDDLFRWVVGPPFGKEFVKVIASKEAINPLEDPAQRQQRFNPVSRQRVKDVAAKMKDAQPVTWAEDRVEITTYGANDPHEERGARRYGLFVGLGQYADIARTQ